MLSTTVWPSTVVNVSATTVMARAWCQKALERFEALGIADRYPDFVTLCERTEALYRSRKAAPVDLQAALAEAATRIAAGEVTLEQATDEMTAVANRHHAAEISDKIMASAITRAGANAVSVLRRHGDRIITDTLAPLLAEVIDEWTDLAPLVDGVLDDSEAMGAEPKVRDAWARMVELEQHAAAIWSTADMLRNAEILPTPRKVSNLPVGEYRWRTPELLPPRGPRGFRPHPVEAFTLALTSGAGPAVLTGAEVLARYTPQEAA